MPAVERALPFWKPMVFAHVCAAVQLLFHRFRAMRQAVAGRRALAGMDERMFADIGISQSEAAYEMNRKPWDMAPSQSERCR
jgi:uncharacterized protein YjiS (DUF1127 family)